MSGALYIFGARSPLVVDLEDTLARLGRTDWHIVALDGKVRALARDRVLTAGALPAPAPGAGAIACAFGPRRREELMRLAAEHGLAPAPALIDTAACVARTSRAGAGCWINAGAVIGAASMLGEGVFVNRAASLGHHCLVEDLASIGPGVTISGNVRIGARAVLGAGAVILPDRRVGADAVVAAGAVVTRDVAPGTLVAGNPAAPRKVAVNRLIFTTSREE